MNFVRRAAFATAALALLTPASGAYAGVAAVFPSVSGHDLNGRSLQLPKDFSGEVDLLFVAFEQRQQDDVNTWKPFADAAAKKHTDLRVYELPVLSRGISLMRGMIDGGMRKAIKDDAARAATVTLYIDKAAFRKALGIESEDHITVLLIRRDGTVLWSGRGPYAAAAQPDLDALLK